jgi:Listeria-Bacteroides repeat domain (List_Bact_rpt)
LPVRAGYTFAGRSTTANGSGAIYQARDFYTINADTTFYAVWTRPSPQKITFEALASKTLLQRTYGATITLLTTGTCTVQASQPGNAAYSPAPAITRSFTVKR